jgi:hypothetical protein
LPSSSSPSSSPASPCSFRRPFASIVQEVPCMAAQQPSSAGTPAAVARPPTPGSHAGPARPPSAPFSASPELQVARAPLP